MRAVPSYPPLARPPTAPRHRAPQSACTAAPGGMGEARQRTHVTVRPRVACWGLGLSLRRPLHSHNSSRASGFSCSEDSCDSRKIPTGHVCVWARGAYVRAHQLAPWPQQVLSRRATPHLQYGHAPFWRLLVVQRHQHANVAHQGRKRVLRSNR